MPLFRPVAHKGFRRVAYYVHFGLGLFLGLWLGLVSLTGSLVVFRDEIEAALRPDLYRVTPATATASVHGLYERVLQAHEGARY